MHFWIRIQENLNTLLEIQNTKGITGFYKRFFIRPKLIGQLYIDLATFEVENIYQKYTQHNEYNHAFSVKDEIFFKSLIDRQLEEKLEYPVKQTVELLKFFESRRVKSLELITTLTAAILGGAIGALLTISLQKIQPNVPNPIEKTTVNGKSPRIGVDSAKKVGDH